MVDNTSERLFETSNNSDATQVFTLDAVVYKLLLNR
jgi:hypothetical protein